MALPLMAFLALLHLVEHLVLWVLQCPHDSIVRVGREDARQDGRAVLVGVCVVASVAGEEVFDAACEPKVAVVSDHDDLGVHGAHVCECDGVLHGAAVGLSVHDDDANGFGVCEQAAVE